MYLNFKKKVFLFISIIAILISSNVYAQSDFSSELQDSESSNIEEVKKSVSDTYNLDEFVNTINDSVNENLEENIDFENMADELLNKNDIGQKSLITKLIAIFAKEISSTIKGSITIFILVIIMSIVSNLELEKNSDITKVAHLACFIMVATITVKTFIEMVTMLKSVVTTLTTLMGVISPFLLSILIATGSISSTGIVQPLLLFLSSSIGFITSYFIIPLICISVAFKVICSVSENIKLEKLSKLFSSISIWTIGVVLTIFLGVLSLETSLSSTVDSLSVKATQAAVSNFVPVVGKFFSDSFEVVVGATKIIGKTGGIIGIVGIFVVAIIPIFKITSVMVIYMILAALLEPITQDGTVSKYLSSFASIYKTLLGILIGITILFIISTGIILNLINNIVV